MTRFFSKHSFAVVLFIGAFLFSVRGVDAATYYIAPTGNDSSGSGSITAPWASLEKLSSVLQAGDTGYVRGGTYRSITPSDENKFKIDNLHGSASAPIKIWAYPGEKPIFNMDNIPATQSGVGMYVSNSDYLHLKGLRVTGLKQCTSGCSVAGMILYEVDNSTVELVEIDNIEGYGLYLQGPQNPGGDGSDNNLIKNVDVHHIGDRYSGWGGANGFNTTGGDLSTNNVFDGCRIWWSSDDGFDFFGTNIYATIKNSWSFWNGYVPGTFTTAGDGYGFKLGPAGNNPPYNELKRVLTNNLAFENRIGGFDQNSGTDNTMRYRLHNNTSFGNGQFSYFFGANTSIPQDFKNNIAVGGSINGSEILSGPNVATNSWNGTVVANNSDFVSVSAKSNPNCLLATVTDTNCPNGPRQADGSLPAMNFLKLAPTSDLINAGTNVGLPYSGTAPDIGAFEYGGTVVTPPSTTFTIGQRVQVNASSLNVRATASATGTLLGSQTSGALGTVTGGPTAADGFVWWNINYDTGVDGWSAETYLTAYTAPTPDTTAPTTPTNLTGTGTTNTAALSWTASTDNIGVSGYRIFRSTTSAGTYTQIGTSTTTSYTDTGLTASTTYYYKVSAYDAAGNVSTQSTSRSVVTTAVANTAPTANAGADQTITLPTSSVTLSGSGTDTDGSIATYAWTKVSTLAGSITSSGSASTTVTSLAQGTHTFRLTVTDNGGLTASDDVVVVVNAQTTAGLFVVGDRVQVYGGSVRVRAAPTTSGASLGTQTSGKLGTVIGGPSVANGYTWWNVNFDTGADGWAIETRLRKYTAPAPDTNAPTTPTNLTGTGTTNTAALSWTASTDNIGVSGYRIFRSTTSAGTYTQIGTSTTTSYTDTGLTASTTYYYKVSAYDAAGNISAQTAAKSVATTAATGGVVVGTTIQTSSMSFDQGYSYQVIGTFGGATADSVSNMTASGLKLYENGVELTRSHASHYDIQTIGQGRFSHWNDGSNTILLFSASDNTNPLTNGRTYSYTIPSVNTAPSANAGADKTITLPTNSVTLTGGGTDSDGTIASYAWTKVSGGSATITSPSSASTTITGLTQGTYSFWLTVTDNAGATNADAVVVTVNAAPTTTIPVSSMSFDQGYSYQVIGTFGGATADTAANGSASGLRLFENSVEIGPAHAYHQDVQQYGQGRFSHWNDGSNTILLFSASDNTNPLTNGRTYSYRVN